MSHTSSTNFSNCLEEVYKTITRNPKYEISNLGNVRRSDNKKEIHPIKMKNNVFKVNLYYEPKSYTQHTLARLVAEHFMENYDSNKNVKHIDKDKSNYKIDNLFQKK